MTDLERSLLALGRELEWPPAPALALRAEPLRPRRRRALVPGIITALLVLGLGAVLAVPAARSSILHFFGIGGVAIERVAALPPAQERPLAATLGTPIGAAAAAQLLGEPVRLPPASGRPGLYAEADVVSTIFRAPAPVLLSEFRTGGVPILEKLVSASSGVDPLRLADGSRGVWIAGAEHLFLGPGAPPRLAGNTLVWQHGDVTYRLEGAGLTKERALELAARIDG